MVEQDQRNQINRFSKVINRDSRYLVNSFPRIIRCVQLAVLYVRSAFLFVLLGRENSALKFRNKKKLN